MRSFEVVLAGDADPQLIQADAYEQEGPMTTFFTCDRGHGRLDSWAVRLASFRSADVRMIRRIDAATPSIRPAVDRDTSRPALDLVTASTA